MPIKADKSLRAYYNEIDPFAAQWIRNLMAEGWITKGDVDDRSIEDVQPNDIAGYDRLHFFAGVAVWDYALNQAGWGRGEIWTGSCPCQPFSAAGAGAGFVDERHLWPAFFHLIQECRPALVLSEQVASKDANPWIDLVQADMEALGYGVGAVAFPAACVGAPHIRDRLYWVGHSSGARLEGHTGDDSAARRSRTPRSIATPSVSSGLADLHGDRREPGRERCEAVGYGQATGADRGPCGLANHLMQQRPDGEPGICLVDDAGGRLESSAAATGLCGDLRTGPTNGFWRDADWLLCRDGKWRPVEPGTFPLVDGPAGRVGRVRADQERLAALTPRKDQGSRAGRLRAYGNSINAKAGEIFIRSVMESIDATEDTLRATIDAAKGGSNA